MSGADALARVLSGYRRTAIDTDQVKVPDLMSAERILADPGPLLAALSEAGVLATERLEWVRDSYGEVPLEAVGEISEPYWKSRYVTEWRPTDARA